MGQELFDGNVSFRGGQNAGVLPDRIGETQYASGVNVTTKDGGLGPRPGFIHQQITVVTEGGVTNLDSSVTPYSTIFRTGKFQMSAPYVTDAGEKIITVISGIIFEIDPVRMEASVIPIEEQESFKTSTDEIIEPSTQRLDQFRARYNWSDAGRFFTIFDYPDFPVIIEGGEARRADPDATTVIGTSSPEIPKADIGTFNQSRLFVGSHVHEFTAGDPVGSLAAPDAPVTFEEVLVPGAPYFGQIFSLGSTNTNNPITAMGFIQLADTSTGIGPLFVSTKDAVYTYRTDYPRDQWESIQFGSLILYNSGMAGPRSFTNVNSDLIFMGSDRQVRTLHTARASQGKWTNAPIDREVRNWTQSNDIELTDFTVSATYKNRVFITVDPFRVSALTLDGAQTRDYAFGGIIVLELDNISGLLRDAEPVWAGIWTGLYFMEMVELGGEFYIWSKDPNNVNNLYKLDESRTYDIFENEIKQITSRIETKQYPFQNKFVLKEEVNIESTLTDLEGDVTVRIDRKSESAPNWIKHRTWKHTATTCVSSDVGCEEQPVLLPHSFRELNFGSPEEEGCSSVNGDSFNYFRKMQYRFTINAKHWKLEDLRAKAEVQEDDGNISINCEAFEDKTVEKDCSDVPDLALYRTPYDTFGDVAAWQ